MRCPEGNHGQIISPKQFGIVAGLLSALAYGLMSYIVHSTSGHIPSTEITFYRSIVALLLTTPFIHDSFRRIFSAGGFVLWLRCLASAVSILCFAWNLQHTSIGIANVLFNISPIIVLILGVALGRTRGSWIVTLCIVLVVVGSSLSWLGASSIPSLQVWLVGLTGTTAAGISYTMLEKQSHFWRPVVLIWTVSLVSIPLMLVLKQGEWPTPTGATLFNLILIGLLCVGGQLFVILSFKNAGLAIGAAIVPSSVIFGVLIDAYIVRKTTQSAIVDSFIYVIGLGWLSFLKNAHPSAESVAPPSGSSVLRKVQSTHGRPKWISVLVSD